METNSIRNREKARLVTSLPPVEEFPENRSLRKKMTERRKRRFTPVKGAIRMSRR